VTDAAQEAVALAARTSYGRLVALLTSRTHDVAAAEDALGDAFLRALRTWPRDGIPDNPDAWLLAAARRRLIDGVRHATVQQRSEPELVHAAALRDLSASDAVLADRRLELLFTCAHPAIDRSIHTPLMLQVVLGLEASEIASAFLVAPAAMAQRLVRAKRKIRDAGIPFEVPDADQLAPRLEAVLEAIYAAFGAGWDALEGSDPQRTDLTDEAIFLGRLVVEALPDSAEAQGLLALMLYCHARRHARRDVTGAYVPLAQQRPAAWDQRMIGEAETLLTRAATMARPGRFQLEAAIQSAHLGRVLDPAWDAMSIVHLYDALLTFAPTVGVQVNRAAAIAAARGAAAGFEAATTIPRETVDRYQPWWALMAHLFAALGREAEAAHARQQAAGLTEDPAVRAFLLGKDHARHGPDAPGVERREVGPAS
jgi:predicted RNA polymerase sigma factor